MDLFVVPTIGFDLLYVLVIVRLARRDLVWINVTSNPTADWIARQITEAFPWRTGVPLSTLLEETERCLSVEYRSWKMFVRESCTAVQMAIAGICVEIHRAKYSCCIRRTSRLAGESLRLSWATSLQEDTALSNRPSCR